MLSSLHIENFAIVAELELDFSSGMTAFTGETGAGKSIMIDALMLALGGRADATVVRTGAEKCEIHAHFHIEADSLPAYWLADHDVTSEDSSVLLRRVLYAEGRSKSYINGHPFPLQKIKELSEMLVDIHGQHQHQTLLNHATHRQQLDHYAQHPELVNEVNHLYQTWQEQKQALKRLIEAESSAERLHLLQYQIEELNQLAPKEGEMQALNEEHHLLHHAKSYLDDTQQILNLLQDDETITLSQGLHMAIQKLHSLPQDHKIIQNVGELLNSALIQCDEAYDEIARFAEQVQLDPERLQEVELRMGALHTAARKFQVDVHQLPAYQANLIKTRETMIAKDEAQQILAVQLQQTQEAYEGAALQLRTSRQQHATKLAQEISKNIQELGMPKGYIQVILTPLDSPHAHGLDKIEYLVCTNPGMQPDTLAKIASGGELSRISLAIHLVTAKRGATPTLLFDEVDVGIGGATAAIVGQQLRQLGDRLQLFCVTHQPQVASCAHHHFLVKKHSDQYQTFSQVEALTDLEKIEEIARMLGGLVVTNQTRSHAKELLLQSSKD